MLNKEIQGVVERACELESDVSSWAEWQETFAKVGLLIGDHPKHLTPKSWVSALEIKDIINFCHIKYTPIDCEPVEQPVDLISEIQDTLRQISRPAIEEWREAYALALKTPPLDHLIRTCDGSPIRIDFSFYSGELPVFWTQIYLPCVVGQELKWVAKREQDQIYQGYRVMLDQSSRKLATEKLDLSKPFGFVKEIKILWVNSNRKAVRAGVTKWA